MDVLTAEQRRRCMSAIRGKDTAPEISLRKALHALGYRYRLHDASLPGKPDLVFSGKRKVIFVHGCYWHRHHCKSGRSVPATRRSFWTEKLEQNRKRDRVHLRALRRLRWSVLVVWQCQLQRNRIGEVLTDIVDFLDK